MKLLKNPRLLFLLSLLPILFVYFRWFLPYPHVSNDLHVTFQDQLKEQLALPSLWGSEGAVGMGENSSFVIWNWPVEALFGLLGVLGLSHNFINQLFALFMGLIIGLYGIRRLLKNYNLGVSAQFLSGLFYLTTTYVLLLIDGGQLSIALAYFFIPLTFALIVEAVENSFPKKLLAALFVWLIGVFDIRFVYVLALIISIYSVYVILINSDKGKFKLLLEWILTGFVIGTVMLLLNFYWILPAFYTRVEALPETYSRSSQISFLDFTTLGHAFFLQQPHWYKNVFGKISEIRIEFILIPLLVFSSAILKRRSKIVGFWLLMALIGVFLTKGGSEPFPNVYNFLFTNIPGFSLFRDSTKFFFLVSLAYSVLFAFNIDTILKILTRSNRLKNNLLFNPAIFVSFVLIYIGFLTMPVWNGKMTGSFSRPVYEVEFEKINNTLKSDENFGRVMWIPTKAPLGYSSSQHPSVEALRFFDKRPFSTSVVGSYEVFNFIREGKAIGELFEVFGIKYIGYPFPDERREELKEDNISYYYAFLDQISSLPWVEGKLSDSNVPLLKTKSSTERIFAADKSYLVVGSDKIYNELVNNPEFKLKNNAIYFAEEKPGLADEVLKNTDSKIIFYGKEKMDLTASLVPSGNYIFPSQNLPFSPDSSGWWKRESGDYLWFRNFLHEKYAADLTDFDYGGGYAISEGEHDLTVKSGKLRKGDTILVRMMNTKNGGSVQLLQGGRTLNGSVATNGECLDKETITLSGYKEIPEQNISYDCAFFFWATMGELIESGEITIKTSGNINVINAIVSIPGDELISISNKISPDRILELDTTKNELSISPTKKPILAYQRNNPTSYTVEVKDLTEPTTLVFSEKYDPFWGIRKNGTSEYKKATPVYSQLNAFYVSENGEYEIFYTPQKYILPAFAISLTSFLTILLYMLTKRKDL